MTNEPPKRISGVTFEDIVAIFGWGIDYGLLLAEQERDGEAMSDALVCSMVSKRTNHPTTPLR